MYTCSYKISETTNEDMILIEDKDGSCSSDEHSAKTRKWIEISNYLLSSEDEKLLLSPTGWLNDNLIDAAQALHAEKLL